MDIVIVAQYLSDLEHLEMTNGRFIYLAQMLKEKEENEVEIITTTFLHGTKKQAKNIPKEFKGCKITALYEPGYPKNVCLKRFYSHHKLADNVKKYLEERKKPDVIYAAVPSLSVAETSANYCKKKGVRFIVDIQDLWPEAFKMVFNIPAISDLIFEPMRRQANRIYAAADDIVSVSQTYADRGLKVNDKCKKVQVVYLGTEKRTFDMWAKRSEDDCRKIKIVYIGSLSHSYDLNSVIEAIKTIKDKDNVELVVMGDGALKKAVENHAREANIHYQFTGMIPYPRMVEKLHSCDIAVNPICRGSAGSIINKVSDYAMAGLPIVNTQESKEYRELLEEYGAGINCECGNVASIAQALQYLIMNKKLRQAMGENSRKLGIEKFDRNCTYEVVVDNITKNTRGGVFLAYVGTLGHSYNISVVISAMKKLSIEELKKIKFIVMGDGPRRKKFEEEAEGLPVYFTGSLAYGEMVWVLARCDIAVNPIVHGAAQSIINKHMDYAMAGLPVINTQECLEYRELIEKFNCGINCECENEYNVLKAIRALTNSKNMRNDMGRNHRKMAETIFDRARSYGKICTLIKGS